MNLKSVLIILCWVVLTVFINGCQQPTSCLIGDKFKQQGDLMKAVDSYEECLKSLGSGSAKKSVMRDVAALKTQIANTVIAESNLQVQTSTTVSQLEKTINDLEIRLKYDDAQNQIALLIKEYNKKKDNLITQAQMFISAAEEQSNGRQWNQAFLNIDSAAAIYPNYPQLTTVKEKVVYSRDNYYQEIIEDACTKGDWQKAEINLKYFEKEKPGPNESLLQKIQSIVKDTKETVVQKQAQTLIEQKKYFAAYRMINNAQVTQSDILLGKIRREGSAYYANLAHQEKTNMKDYSAYVAVAKAKELNPDNNEIFTLYKNCADYVEDSVQMRIGIATFGSPQNEPDAGREFSDTLISYLSKILPYGVKIDEREKIDFTVEKEGLKDAVRLLGLNFAVFGNVSTLNVDTKQSERVIIEWVKIPQTIPNPQYEQEVLNMKSRYGNDSVKWPYLPKPTINQEANEKVEYKKGEAKMESAMTVSARIFSAMDGTITKSETFNASREYQDTFQEGVPLASIKDDPLELPTNLKVKQELRQEMINSATKWILSNFEQRHKGYYDRAQYFIDRREYDSAIQALAQGYIYSICEKLPQTDEYVEKIRQLLFYDLTETKELISRP